MTVVDIWGGHADAARTRPWTRDTIVNVWSSPKTVTALAGLMLIDRGLIAPDTLVASVWPEFGANGKGHVEFRHLLTHSSGVSCTSRSVPRQRIHRVLPRSSPPPIRWRASRRWISGPS